MPIPERYEIANPDEAARDEGLLLFQFGAVGATNLYVWSGSVEDGLETAGDWLRENAPGHIVQLTEQDYREAAEDVEVEWQSSWPDWEDRNWEKIAEHAEADLTQLDAGDYLLSYEWWVNDITDPDETEEIYKESHRIQSEQLAAEETVADVSQPKALTVLDDARLTLATNDLTPADVLWVGSSYGDYAMMWGEFEPIAKDVYRSEDVDDDLVIVAGVDEWFEWVGGYGFRPGRGSEPVWTRPPDAFNTIVPRIGVLK